MQTRVNRDLPILTLYKNSVLWWWALGTNQLLFSSIAEILRRVVSLSEKEPFFFRVSAQLANTKRHIVGEEMKWGHVSAILFLVWHARFCKSVLLQGQVFFLMTCCVKFNWLMCHEAGANDISCAQVGWDQEWSHSRPQNLSFFWSRNRRNVTLFPGSLTFASLEEREPGSEVVPSERRKRNKHTHWFDCVPVSQVYFVDCENQKSYELDMLCNSQNLGKHGVISTSFPPPSQGKSPWERRWVSFNVFVGNQFFCQTKST